jgi:hypothetical protein
MVEFKYKVQFKNLEDVYLTSRFTSPKAALAYVNRLKEEGNSPVYIFRLNKEKESPTTFEFLKKEASECRTSGKKSVKSSRKSSKR